MENSIWILGVIVIVLCALIFFKKVIIRAKMTGIEISGEDSPQKVKILNSKKIKTEQSGSDQSIEIDNSEELDIKQK